ncbi:hypothetical protein [Limibacillus sp. MBR-115]|jgi:hypothetical protein|uniref:hypothetical protein n=1 Tax=Limibacillus sp. MBR-115 TaxID=3156465 RepID=UPI0033922EAA
MEWLLLVFFLERTTAAPLEVAFPSQDLCRMAAWQMRIDWATQLQDKGVIEEARPSDAPIVVTCIRTSGEPRKSDGLGYDYLLLERRQSNAATGAAGGNSGGDAADVNNERSRKLRQGERPPLPDNESLRRSSED